MIYLDNAATTLVKPPAVKAAVAEALESFGSVGRGVHASSLAAGSAVYEARRRLAELFDAPSPAQVAFALNVTEALNTALCGLAMPGDHVITTAASHNSVLRPLFRLRDQGVIELDVAPIRPDGSLDYAAFEDLFRPSTKLVALTHASNLTGDIYDLACLAALVHAHDARIVVDAAQTAGTWPISQRALDVDVLAFTGHKGLFGPQGTGGLCVAEGVQIRPLVVGGAGMHSFDETHPTTMPERLEAGTLNAHGIAGLGAGVAFVQQEGLERIVAHDQRLAKRFREGARAIPGVRLLGGGEGAQCAIVALTLGEADSAQVSDLLSYEFGIATRAGAHCAPLMHKALGTAEQGAVRFSFSFFNTEKEVDQALCALDQIARAF